MGRGMEAQVYLSWALNAKRKPLKKGSTGLLWDAGKSMWSEGTVPEEAENYSAGGS